MGRLSGFIWTIVDVPIVLFFFFWVFVSYAFVNLVRFQFSSTHSVGFLLLFDVQSVLQSPLYIVSVFFFSLYDSVLNFSFQSVSLVLIRSHSFYLFGLSILLCIFSSVCCDVIFFNTTIYILVFAFNLCLVENVVHWTRSTAPFFLYFIFGSSLLETFFFFFSSLFFLI